jgi:hypothetical protein
MRPTYELAIETAHAFVLRERATTLLNGKRNNAMPFDKIGALSWKYMWDEDRFLYEFPLLSEANEPVGFVIASGDRSLPPIISYSLDGQLLSARLNALLQDTIPEVPISEVQWFYFSPLDLVARLPTREKAAPVYVTVPRFSAIRMAEPIRRNPADCWAPKHVSERWDTLFEPTSERRYQTAVQLPHSPIPYNQSCSGYPLAVGKATREPTRGQVEVRADGGGNLCGWRGISGCAPVAWAVLASWWKQDPRAAAKIWPGSTCWNYPWSTSYFPKDPTLCAEVSSSIWGFHAYCSTSFDGTTDPHNVYAGFGLFRDRFGLQWSWAGDWTAPQFGGANPYDIARRVINGGQACMYCATGPWSQYGGAGSGDDGHCTVAYGANDSDRKILICFCWGDMIPDQWIDPMDFSGGSANLIYVNGFSAADQRPSGAN